MGFEGVLIREGGKCEGETDRLWRGEEGLRRGFGMVTVGYRGNVHCFG